MPTHRKLFVKLAVDDLDRSVEFFTNLGFPSSTSAFTDETATCMVIGEDAYAMRLRKPRFAEFATQADLRLHDAHRGDARSTRRDR